MFLQDSARTGNTFKNTLETKCIVFTLVSWDVNYMWVVVNRLNYDKQLEWPFKVINESLSQSLYNNAWAVVHLSYAFFCNCMCSAEMCHWSPTAGCCPFKLCSLSSNPPNQCVRRRSAASPCTIHTELTANTTHTAMTGGYRRFLTLGEERRRSLPIFPLRSKPTCPQDTHTKHNNQ